MGRWEPSEENNRQTPVKIIPSCTFVCELSTDDMIWHLVFVLQQVPRVKESCSRKAQLTYDSNEIISSFPWKYFCHYNFCKMMLVLQTSPAQRTTNAPCFKLKLVTTFLSSSTIAGRLPPGCKTCPFKVNWPNSISSLMMLNCFAACDKKNFRLIGVRAGVRTHAGT